MSNLIRLDPFLISLGLVSGWRALQLKGHNFDIDINDCPEDLCPWGGLYAFQTSAVALEAVSTSANDTSAGTGARTVFVSGLDASWEPQTETVTLNGVTPVATANNYLRVNFFTVLTAGSTGANDGTVTLQTVSGDVPQAQVLPGENDSFHGVYTVSALEQGWIGPSIFAGILRNAATSESARLGLWARVDPGLMTFRNEIPLHTSGTSTFVFSTPAVTAVGSKTDLVARCSEVSADSTAIHASLYVLLRTI